MIANLEHEGRLVGLHINSEKSLVCEWKSSYSE